MDYAKKFNFVKDDVLPDVEGEYELVMLYNYDEPTFSSMDAEEIVVDGLSFKANKTRATGTAELAVLDVDDTVTVPEDTLRKVCQKLNIAVKFSSAKNMIIDFAKDLDDMETLQVAQKLSKLIDETYVFGGSILMFKTDNAIRCPLNLKNALGETVQRMYNAVFVFEGLVYDICNGYVGMPYLEYIDMLYQCNNLIRLDLGYTRICGNWLMSLHEDTREFLKDLAVRETCAESRKIFYEKIFTNS